MRGRRRGRNIRHHRIRVVKLTRNSGSMGSSSSICKPETVGKKAQQTRLLDDDCYNDIGSLPNVPNLQPIQCAREISRKAESSQTTVIMNEVASFDEIVEIS